MSAITPKPTESPVHTKMARARAAVRSDRVADAERGRARTASLPSLDELELTAQQISEEIVTVRQAAELLGISPQAVNQLIVRGSLAAYRDARGRRVITVVDLVESRAAQRQAAQEAAQEMRRAQHVINRDNPISSESREDRCVGTWEDCRVCGPITLVYEAEGDELIDVPQPVKRPVSAAKLASLERARAAKVLADARRRLERERDIAEMKARIEAEGHGPAA